MTHLKKSLAMLLALIMMFSSMSVAANAWNPEDDPCDITFTVKFFRFDADEVDTSAGKDGWIETTNAAPGEKVKARVYVKTGFYTHGGDCCFIFDKTFFTADGFENNKRRDITVNKNYAGPADDAYAAGEYNLQSKGVWKDAANFHVWNEKGNNLLCGPLDYITKEIEKDDNFFDTYDLISHNIQFGNLVNNSKLTDDDWMYELDFVVNDNPVTNTIDNEGDAEVPPYYYSAERTAIDQDDIECQVDLFISFNKGESGVYYDDPARNMHMFQWVPEFYTNPGTITTTSEVVFDMGLVDKDGNWDAKTYQTEKGIISKDVDLTKVTDPTHPDGNEFLYWSTEKPGTGASQTEATAVKYDHDVQTLYAVWGEAPQPSDAEYTLNEYFMNADGTYPLDAKSTTKYAAPGSTVSAEKPTDERYSLDEAMSSKNVVIDENGSSVVNAYYERNKYKFVYHYEGENGEQTDDYLVRFGDKIPVFSAGSPEGEPLKTGYTFKGWSSVKGGTIPETLPTEMPTEEIHFYPIFEENDTYVYEYIFNAGEGKFADGESVKRYFYQYLEDTTTPEEPTAPGKKFVSWDDEIPAKADGNKEFKAIYEDELYTVTFKADTDKDGIYETIVPTTDKKYVYGEKLYSEDAPENYPLDKWKLSDGTSVAFGNDENTAYTVTGDVTFYTVGSDEYPATFYWSQEDYEKGAEPFKTLYVKFDTEIPDPGKPEKPGYNFLHWDLDLDGQFMDSTEGKAFYAIFEAKDITVTYNPNKGECDVPSVTVKYDEDAVIKLPAASRDGYEFKGWVDPDGTNVGTTDASYSVPTDNITLTADWDAEEHTITFVDTDGKELGKITADTDEEITTPDNLNPPVKEGHEFTGWTAEGVTGTVTVPATMPTDDMTLTATWNKLSYALNADANGGEFDDGTDKISESILFGDPLNVEQPDLEGHKFLGWAYADDESNTIITLPEEMPSKPLNIKAVWDTNKHDVKYDANGGVFTNADGSTTGFREFKDIEYGAAVPSLNEIPSKEGYEFVRWAPEAPKAMPDNDLTFTAEWKKEEVPVEQEYKVYISYPNPADPTETLKKEVITDSALPGTTVEIIKSGETQTADKAHTYEEILANVDVNGIEPDYENRPATMTVSANGGELIVEFKLTEYKVEFAPNGGKFGESDDSVVVKGTWGQAVDAPANPTRTGYNFTGWDKNVPATFTEDLVITATWEIQKHNAIFVVVDENGNEKARIPVEYEYGDAITSPDYTAPAGYDFNGWDIPAGTIMGEEDITFTSTLEPIYYSVAYEISGLPADKGVTAPATQSGLRYDDKVDVAAAPEVEGYTFDGWYDGRVKYGADGKDKIDAIQNNITLTGTYTAKEFTITYDTDGAGSIAPEKYDCDEIVSALPTVSKDGYEFLGWYDGDTKVEAGFKMPAKDINLTAKWEKNIVNKTITLDANGGKFDNGDPTYTINGAVDSAVTAPANPTREGYVFDGWVDAKGNETTVPSKIPAEDVTITAKWAELYDVTYYEEDGTTVIKTFVDAGKEGAALPAIDDPVKDGWHFTGWVDKDGNKVTAIPAGNLDLFATFSENAPTEFTITYKDTDGTILKTVTYAVDAPIADYAPDEVVGKTFKGWSPALPENMPGENLTVTAVWETNKHSFTLDANGGTFAGDEPVFTDVFEYGTDLSDKLPENPTRDGYEFAGWDGELPATMPDNEVSLKATWTPVGPATHKVEYFYAVDGDVYKTLTVEEGKPVVHPADPTVEGLTFKGWVDKDGNAIPDDLVMGTEDIKIYAKFDVNTYKVTYIVDGTVYKEYEVLYQAEIPVPADPADSETRLFAGWDGEATATMPAHDLEYTAKWVDATEPGEYTATFLRHNGETYAKRVLKEGDEIPVPAAPQRFGYVFVGWEPEVPEVMPAQDMVFEPVYEVDKTFVTIVVGGTVIAGGVIGASIANAAIITGASIVGGILVIVGVAELVKHTHTVTFIVDGEEYKTYKVVEGTKIPVPADPVKDGYTFEGWNPEVPEKMGDSDLVFEAVWGVKAADDSADVDVEIPETGSVAGGLTAFAVISGAAAAAYVFTRRKKED